MHDPDAGRRGSRRLAAPLGLTDGPSAPPTDSAAPARRKCWGDVRRRRPLPQRRAIPSRSTSVRSSTARTEDVPLGGALGPTEQEFSAVRQSSTSTRSPSRARSRPTSGPSSSSSRTAPSWCCAPPATSRDTETVEFGELQVFFGRGFIVTVRHGAAAPLNAVRLELEDRPRAPVVRTRRRAAPSSTTWSTATNQCCWASGRHRRGGGGGLLPEQPNPVERIYYLQARCSRMIKATRLAAAAARALLPLHDIEYLHDDIAHYFRDVLDHLLRVEEQVECLQRDAHQHPRGQPGAGQHPARTGHEEMAAWAAIGIVPYGPGGRVRHELPPHARAAVALRLPMAILTIVVVCLLLYRNFKRVGWL